MGRRLILRRTMVCNCQPKEKPKPSTIFFMVQMGRQNDLGEEIEMHNITIINVIFTQRWLFPIDHQANWEGG